MIEMTKGEVQFLIDLLLLCKEELDSATDIGWVTTTGVDSMLEEGLQMLVSSAYKAGLDGLVDDEEDKITSH